MAEGAHLRTVAAELRAEVDRIGRVVDEIDDAIAHFGDGTDRLVLYAGAALLETFYTGVEKALRRVALPLGGLPEGSDWHRELLRRAALDIPGVRPPVLGEAQVAALEPYLAFRHRFRNLYLFDLDPRLVLPLLTGARDAWSAARSELMAFADVLVGIAERIERG